MKILVLDVPALNLGYLGCYGNDWVGTPNLDRLASESVVFERHYYDVLQPALLDWTGHHFFPGPRFIDSRSVKDPFSPPPTFEMLLKQFNHDFDFIAGAPEVSLDNLQSVLAKTLAVDWEKQALLGVRFPSLAPPWNLPEDLLDSYCEEEDEPWLNPPQGPVENIDDLPRLQNTYAAVVTYIDARLGDLLDSLRSQKRLDDLLVCLTSSSGLPLGEHGNIGFARPWPHEEFVHLPLLLRLPHGECAGLRLDALTQPVDLFPTLLAFLGCAVPPCHGHDLWPLIRGEVHQVRPYACTALHWGDAEEWAMRTLEWALLLPVHDPTRLPRLFIKPEDRWEVNDVRHHHMERAEEMEKTLREVARDLSFRARAAL